jgi:hypothetical protein
MDLVGPSGTEEISSLLLLVLVVGLSIFGGDEDLDLFFASNPEIVQFLKYKCIVWFLRMDDERRQDMGFCRNKIQSGKNLL